MIERFIEQYSEQAYSFAYHLTGNQEDAKELVQEAFVRMISRWEQVDHEQRLESWFMTILKNLYFDSVRKFEKRQGVSLDAPFGDEQESWSERLADREEAVLDRLERKEGGAAIQRALKALTPEHRAILLLSARDGLGYEEIAETLDCPLGTVRSRLNRARAAFQRALIAEGQEVAGA